MQKKEDIFLKSLYVKGSIFVKRIVQSQGVVRFLKTNHFHLIVSQSDGMSQQKNEQIVFFQVVIPRLWNHSV